MSFSYKIFISKFQPVFHELPSLFDLSLCLVCPEVVSSVMQDADKSYETDLKYT